MPEVPTLPTASSSSNLAVVRRLFALAWRYRLHCLQVLGLQLVLLTMGISGLSLTGVGIDYIKHKIDGSPPGANPLHLALPDDWPSWQVLGLLAGVILVLAGARALLNFTYAVSVNRLVQQRLVVDLRGEVYDKLQRLSFRFFDANNTGSIITRVTSDAQSVRMFVDQVLIQSVIMVISLTVYVIYMVNLSPSLTLACLATTPLLWVLSVWHARRTQPEYAQNRTLVEKMVQTFVESIQGIAVTKAFGRETEDRARFEAANNAVLAQQQVIFWRVSLFSPAMGFLTRINMMVLLGYGGWLVIQGRLPLGAGLVVFAGLLEQFSGQINNVATIINSVQQSLIGARRVFEILDAPVEVKSPRDALRRPKLQGDVRFENVSFTYDGAQAVVRSVDLHVPPGQCVAILGATGAGKSVLMSLVPRFFDPTAGRVLIDGNDARHLELDDLRRNMASSSRRVFCSPTPSPPTSRSATRRPHPRKSNGRRASPRPTTSSCSSRRVTTRCSARAATAFPAASGSASPSPGPCCSSRRSCCSMTPPPRSTAKPNTRFSRPSIGRSPVAPPSLSRTG
jgi:ATP-binding cassette subfamily B protein